MKVLKSKKPKLYHDVWADRCVYIHTALEEQQCPAFHIQILSLI